MPTILTHLSRHPMITECLKAEHPGKNKKFVVTYEMSFS
jgi:hypothetical protein